MTPFPYIRSHGLSYLYCAVVEIYYGDVIMGAIASQITSLTIVYSTVYSDADQRKHQSSASMAFVWEIHRGPHKLPLTRKMFPFDDVIMLHSSILNERTHGCKHNKFTVHIPIICNSRCFQILTNDFCFMGNHWHVNSNSIMCCYKTDSMWRPRWRSLFWLAHWIDGQP